MKIGTVVYDTGRPYRWGSVVKRLKTRTLVRWSDGRVDSYDKSHERWFLRVVDQRKKR